MVVCYVSSLDPAGAGKARGSGFDMREIRGRCPLLQAGLLVVWALGGAGVAGAQVRHISGAEFELSGVGVVPEGILVADDELVGSVLFVPREALGANGEAVRASVVKMQRSRKKSQPNSPLPRLFAVQDVEGIAISGDGETVYLVGSHAPSREKHRRTDREFLIKSRWREDEFDLRVDPAKSGGVPGIYRRLIDDVKEQAGHSGPGGFNVEGLALCEGSLYFGLRAPLSGGTSGNALLLSVAEKDLFGKNSSEFKGPVTKLELDLSGAGVRGLHWDEATEKLLILSGPLADGGDAPQALWSYDFDSKALTMEYEFSPAQLRELGSPEGIARLDARRLVVVFDQDKAAQAGMHLMAWP
jgi:hypothetical protein